MNHVKYFKCAMFSLFLLFIFFINILKIYANSLVSNDLNFPNTCPDGTIVDPENTNNCYYFVEKPVEFEEANYFCNQQVGFLTSIHNEYQNKFITDHLNDTLDYWIGGYIKNTTWTLKWEDQSLFDYNLINSGIIVILFTKI